MYFTAYFSNTGIPATGLSPTISILKVSDNSVVVNAQAMTEVGLGWYKYNYTDYDKSIDYVFLCDGGVTLTGPERYVGGASDTSGDVLQIAEDVDNLPDDIWDETISGHTTAGTFGKKINDIESTGEGEITWTYTVTNTQTGLPIADVLVWVTTDINGSNKIASGRTDQNGLVTFYLDAGTVYIWCSKSGYNFSNPDTEIVS